MAEEIESLLLKLPRRDSATRSKPQAHKSLRTQLNHKVLLTAVLKEQRIYLKQNKYAQELEEKYWHPRIKSMENPIHTPAPPNKSKDYPVNDRSFTSNLKQKFDLYDGVTVSCPRLKSAPGSMRRHELIYKLKKTRGHLISNRPIGPGLPVKVFSPSKGSLFTRYSKVSLQPRPFTAGRQVPVVDFKPKIRSNAVVIPRQILLASASRSPSPESRLSAYNSQITSQAALV